MSCCGQKRRALIRGGASPSTVTVAPAAGSFAQLAGRKSTDVALRYLGVGLFSSRGVRSGRVYVCAATRATVDADPADVDALVRTRLFALA